MNTVLLLFALACSQQAPTPAAPAPAEAPAPSAPPPPAAPAPGAETAALPDLTQDLAHGTCEDWRDNTIPGADGYFAGEYTVHGQTVTGRERWILFANQSWKEKGGADCVIEWNLTGQTGPVGACGDCDLGLKVSATLSVTTTTCLEGLWKKEQKFDVAYDVKRNADGSAVFYFNQSGKQLGQGYHQGDKLNYITEHKCNWF